MTHNVMIPNQIAAMNVDAWNRSGVYSSTVDNGNIVKLTTLSATTGEAEVFTAVIPSTSNGLTNVWMVYEPEVVVTNAQYKGLSPDPRNFFVAANKTFSCFKPQISDIITMSADGMSGSKGGSDTHVNATDSTGGLKLVWGTSQTGSVFSMKLIETTYISIADGSIGNQRVTAYKFEVVGL